MPPEDDRPEVLTSDEAAQLLRTSRRMVLGHERIDMTMRYAHLAKDGVKHQVALMDERRSGQNEGGRGIFLSPESAPGTEVRKP